MSKKLARMLALIFALSLVISLTSSLGARGPQSQERPRPLIERRPLELPPTGRFRHRGYLDLANWAQTYGKFFSFNPEEYSEYDDCIAILPAENGGVVVAGIATLEPVLSGDAINDWAVMEINPLDGVRWKVLFEADPATPSNNSPDALIKTREGGYLMVGGQGSSDYSTSRALVMKLSHTGGVEWLKAYYQGHGQDEAEGAAQMPDGGYIVVVGGSNGLWLMRLDPSGNALWHRQVGTLSLKDKCTIQATADGGFFLSRFGLRPEIIKFDGAGHFRWHKFYDSSMTDPSCCYPADSDGRFASCTADGGYLLAGDIHCGECEEHSAFLGGFLCKLDQSGNIVWQRGYRSFAIDSVIESKEAGYLVVGFGLMKLDPIGNIQWAKDFNPYDSGFYLGSAGFQTDSGDYILIGTGDFDVSAHENRRMGVMSLGLLGPTDTLCSHLVDRNQTGMKPLMDVVFGGASSLRDISIQSRTLEYIPYPRTCEIKTICPSSEGSRSRPPRQPVHKR